MLLDKDTWDELTDLIDRSNKNLETERMDAALATLREFSATSAMLMAESLEQIGTELEKFFTTHVQESGDPEHREVLAFSLNALKSAMETNADNPDPDTLNAEEILIYVLEDEDETTPEQTEEAPAQEQVIDEPEAREHEAEQQEAEEPLSEEHTAAEKPGEEDSEETGLDAAATPEAEIETAPAESSEETAPSVPNPADLLVALQEDLERFGGAVSISSEDKEEIVSISIPRDQMSSLQSAITQRLIESATLLSADHPKSHKVIDVLSKFVSHFSSGELDRAQEALALLADEEFESSLFKEMGRLARGFHESINGFTKALDPALTEFAENLIPDSGYRLEHILEMTENAANKTLNIAEEMQQRNNEDSEKLDNLLILTKELSSVLAGTELILNSNGAPVENAAEVKDVMLGMISIAQKQTLTINGTSKEISESTTTTDSELMQLIVTQDYQDLSGQIIRKVIDLLNDLEEKLVSLISKFGMKMSQDPSTATKKDDLYGPSHKHKTDSCHSQGDVDDILNQFGF